VCAGGPCGLDCATHENLVFNVKGIIASDSSTSSQPICFAQKVCQTQPKIAQNFSINAQNESFCNGFSIERANEILRYGIGVLQGKHVVSRPEGRVQIALILKRDLEDMGALWQARVLNFWIHRAQGGEFL